MNQKNIFDKLADHLGKGGLAALPKTSELYEMLEILFTPEEVAYALQMPLARRGEVSAGELAGKTGKPLETVRETIETMARAGTVQAIKRGKDEKLYCSLFPLVPGIMESTYADGIDNDKKDRLAKLWEKYFRESFWEEQTRSKYPLMRIIPINQRLDSGSRVLPFEEVGNIVKNAETLTIIECFCRSVSKKCNHLMETDIVLNDWAEYLIQYRGARRWTQEEVIQRLIECEEDGLVHLTGNTQDASLVICNCCPCCCGALRSYVELQNTCSIAQTNFEPRVDHEACTLCMSCAEICPTKAILDGSETAAGGKESQIMVEASLCIGCGLCSTHCPENAVQMVKVHDVLPAKNGLALRERYIAERTS
jgi:electron transport complex protein RnfB